MSLNNKNIVPFDKFMSDMLYNVKKGYYMKTNPFGKSGDFITAPNLSVMFSEMIAIWCISFLKNKAKTLVDIFNNAKYIIQEEISFNQDDLKLIDDKAKKIVQEFKTNISSLDNLNREILEPIVNNLIKKHETNFKGVGQPLRVILTGSKFGPGLYDILISLGKEEVDKRLGNKIIRQDR